MVVIFSDPHLHPYLGSPVTASGANKRMADVLAAMVAVLDDAVACGATSVVCCGDLFHDRKGVPPDALHAAGDWLDAAHDRGIELHLLVGNHDMSLDAGAHSLRGFGGRAHLYAGTCLAMIEGQSFGFIPYAEDPRQVRASASLLAKGGARYIVGHVGLGDPRHANCVPVDYEVPGRINLDDLRPDDFEQVFLGHYHLAQRLGDRVRYVGSPLQLSYGEADHPKGWLRLDPASGRVTKVANEVSPRYHIVSDAASAAQAPADDFVWVRAANRDEEQAAQALDRPNMRIDRAPVADVPPRIDAGAKGADLLRSYVQAVRPDALTHEVDELVGEGLRLKGGT